MARIFVLFGVSNTFWSPTLFRPTKYSSAWKKVPRNVVSCGTHLKWSPSHFYFPQLPIFSNDSCSHLIPRVRSKFIYSALVTTVCPLALIMSQKPNECGWLTINSCTKYTQIPQHNCNNFIEN